MPRGLFICKVLLKKGKIVVATVLNFYANFTHYIDILLSSILRTCTLLNQKYTNSESRASNFLEEKVTHQSFTKFKKLTSVLKYFSCPVNSF